MQFLLSIFFLFWTFSALAQNTYKTNLIHIVTYEEIPLISQDIFKDVPEPYREIVSKNVKPLPSYYELSFSNHEALYKKIQRKAATSEDMNTGNIQMKHTIISFGETIEMYENYKTKDVISFVNILDKEFLISENLKEINWELINETKTIGNIECRKAQKKNGDFITEVWYAPGIPTMAGPGSYWGLPGLIIEVKDKTHHFIATQIKENVSGKIEVPAKGKKISREEFKKLSAESISEWTRDKPNGKVTIE